jgi:methylglutamate dehydrogenase subunit D
VTLPAQPAFGSVRCNADVGAGVVAAGRNAVAIARVALRKGRTAPAAQRVQERFAVALPFGPTRIDANGLAFIGVGVETWLVTAADRGPAELVEILRSALGELVTVSDQSSGYGILRLSGARVRESLAKLLGIDLHPNSFQPGDVACTLASHIPILLWRLADSTEGAQFELAVPRSYAGSFSHLLTESAAEFGFALTA